MILWSRSFLSLWRPVRAGSCFVREEGCRRPVCSTYLLCPQSPATLPRLSCIEANFPVTSKRAISGHSMGGHGALTIGMKNPDRWERSFTTSPSCLKQPWGCEGHRSSLQVYARAAADKLSLCRYTSVSAFAPICNPMNVPWGQKAFKLYLGEDQQAGWLDVLKMQQVALAGKYPAGLEAVRCHGACVAVHRCFFGLSTCCSESRQSQPVTSGLRGAASCCHDAGKDLHILCDCGTATRFMIWSPPNTPNPRNILKSSAVICNMRI